MGCEIPLVLDVCVKVFLLEISIRIGELHSIDGHPTIDRHPQLVESLNRLTGGRRLKVCCWDFDLHLISVIPISAFELYQQLAWAFTLTSQPL